MELVAQSGSGSVGGKTSDSRVSGSSLSELLAHQVAARPDAVAVVQGTEVLRYRELAQRYTSGSTGKPKGVMIEHRSIVSQLRWLAAEYGVDSSKVVPQKTLSCQASCSTGDVVSSPLSAHLCGREAA